MHILMGIMAALNSRFLARLSDDEERRLLDACGHDGVTNLRNRAAIAILYRAGMRTSEALALEPKDLNLDHGTYRTCRIDQHVAVIVQA